MSGPKSAKDYLYTTEIAEQVGAVSFLGDLYSFADEEFFPVEKKTLVVKSLSVTEEKFVGEVILADAYWSQAPKKYDRVVVGVEISIPRPGKKPLPGSWILTGSEGELKDYSQVKAAVSPGEILVTTYYFQTLKRFIPSISENALGEFSFGRNLKEVADSIELTKNTTKDILGERNYYQCLISAEQLSEELNNLVQDRIRNLTSDNWARLTYFLIKQYEMVDDYIKYSNTVMAVIQKLHKDKRSLIQTFKNKSIEYVDTKEQWLRINAEHLEVYALMLGDIISWKLNNEVGTFLLDLKRRSSGKNTLFCVVDENLVYSAAFETPPPFAQIKKYIKGKCATKDVMGSEGFKKYNVTACYGERQKVVPKRRTLLRVACPGSFGEIGCQGGIREWLCCWCKYPIYYAFELGLYCEKCGASAVENFKFRCDDIKHFDPIFITAEQCGELNALPPMAEKNVLLLGPSDGGKSTWISATCNYMSFKTLENAEKYSSANTPVASKVFYTDRSKREWNVTVGPNKNRNSDESTTRDCQNCSVVLDDVVFNLIDTPSLGVSGGVGKDRKNIKKILDYVRNIEELHGICILLNPDETKKTARLNYCLKEIFLILNKSVSENLMFCVTNTRSENFRSANTLRFLGRLLESIGLNLSLEDRMFYMDNEAFNYLCCRREENSYYSAEDRSDFLRSWAKSTEETTRLLRKMRTLPPHRVVDTLAIYQARVVVDSLVSPIRQTAETAKARSDELRAKQADVERSKIAVDQIQIGTTTTYRLKSVPLSHPRTVCISDKCVDKTPLGKSRVMPALYKQHCHPECYCLQDVGTEANATPALKRCAVIGPDSLCTKCGCSWETHIVMSCDQALEEVLEENETDITRKREATAEFEAKKVKLDEFEKLIKDRASERHKIRTIGLCFAHFLKENAIVIYNDSIGEYLAFLRSVPNDASESEKTIRSKIFQLCSTQNNNIVTVDNIEEYLQQLYTLPLYGDQLKAEIEMAMKHEESKL